MVFSQAVSVYIITKNEARNIRALLDQLTQFPEVIIVDSGSTDRTLEIAREYPNVQTHLREWTGFSDQKAYALSLCSAEWVLNLDADEELTPEYLDAMATTMDSKHAALQSTRILYRQGRKPRTLIKPDILIRFFRKQCGHYPPARVHESISIEGSILETQASILHHEDLNYTQRIAKSNQYSQLKAEDKLAMGKRVGTLHLVLSFPVAFLQCYLGKACFLDGKQGWLTSMNHAFYNFMKYAKLWELQQRKVPAPETQSTNKPASEPPPKVLVQPGK